MNKKQALFSLINSLDKNEKRYFILSSSLQSGSKTYLQLFDYLAKQKEYNEILLKKYVVTSGLYNFNYTVSYLYQSILKSMRAYRSDISVDMQLKGFLSDIDFLSEKGLHQQALTILIKAKKIAYDYEKDEYILEMINKEKLIMSEMELLTNEDIINSMVNENNNILIKLQNKSDYATYFHKIFYFLAKKGKVRSKKEMVALETIMKNPLLRREKMALSYQAKNSFYSTYAYYYWIKDDIRNYYKYCKLILEHIEAYPHQLKLKNNHYAISLYNFIIAQTHCKEYEGALSNIKKLRAICSQKINTQSIQFLSYSAELGIYLKTGEFEKGVPVIEEIQSTFDKAQGKVIKQRIILYDSISQIYFGLGEYKEALKWSNKILNSKENLRESFYSYAMFLNLLIHYELDNYRLLEYLVRSTHRFLYKQQNLYQFEIAVLDFIRKLLKKLFSRKELRILFKNLKADLLEITKDPLEKQALDYFDFISWLDSKLERRSFGEVVRGKLVES